MEHLQVFLSEHPELKELTDENRKLLEWAEEQRYITMRKFGSKKFYTEQQLDDALMWAKKLELLDELV